MCAQFPSRQDSNLRGKIPTDFKSVALTTRPRLPGYKNYYYRIIFILVFQKIKKSSAFDPQFRGTYIWKISKKRTLEISKSNNFMVCMYVKLYFNTLTSTIIYNWFPRRAYTHKELNVELYIEKICKNPTLKLSSSSWWATILILSWWATKVNSNTIRKFWTCSAQWKSMTLITFTTGRKQTLKRNFCVISNLSSRHDLNMRGKIPTDFWSVALTTRPWLPESKDYRCCHLRWGSIFIIRNSKNKGSVRSDRIWNTDFSICSRMLYHCPLSYTPWNGTPN